MAKPSIKDLAERAASTFFQAFGSALGVVWVASGVNVSQITDINAAKRIGGALLVGAGGAALSALKTTVKAMGQQAVDDPAEVQAVLDALGVPEWLDTPVRHDIGDLLNKPTVPVTVQDPAAAVATPAQPPQADAVPTTVAATPPSA